MARRFLYATTRRGTIKATKKQHKLLEARKLPHTDWYLSKNGNKYGVRKYNK